MVSFLKIEMKYLYKIFLVLFFFQTLINIAFSEITGNLSINMNFTNISTNIVTGLYGMTVTTTTIFQEETNTTTTVSIPRTTSTTTTSTTTTTTTTTSTTTTTVILRELQLKDIELDLNKTNNIITELKDFVKDFIKFDEKKAKRTTEKIIKNLSIRYELWIENGTNLTVTISYNGDKKINNLIIYQFIPKSFAKTTKEIGIISSEKPRIIEDDPKILFISPSIERGKNVTIVFYVDKRVKKDVVNEFETIVFADDFYLEIDKIYFILPLIFVVIILIIYYIYEKSKRGVTSKYSFRRRYSIFFVIKMKLKLIKQKIKEKFKREEETFRYQYKT